MNKYFLITGYTAGATGNYLTYDQVINSSNLQLFSIPSYDVSIGIARKNWTKGSKFTPWSKNNSVNSYVFYNDKVYLCVSNNEKNIVNLPNSSNIPPTHTSGKVKYSDGYVWLYLYTISANVINMVNSVTIPAPSSYGLKKLVIGRETDDVNCGTTAGATGICALYLTDDSKTTANLIYSSGVSCESCKNTAEETTKTDLLTTVFYPQGSTLSSTISIKTPQEFLEFYISTEKINSKLNFEARCYVEAKSSGISAGAILGAFINLNTITGVSAAYLNLTASELPITVTGGGGTAASIEFITVNNSGLNQITGIRLTSGGTNYTTEQTQVSLSGIADSTKRNTIQSAISLSGTAKSLTFTNINSIFDAASTNSIGTDGVLKIINSRIDAHSPNTNYYALIEADPYTNETIQELCPSVLKIYSFTSSGLTFGREYLNVIFNQPISQTEIQMR
ncbi:MAG: hypothetical protein FJ167_03855 [Gammaproteobacteria bacterium]|nr:hypothetical protein [Gammaproteobacteria bacterium]